jgi:anti-sigma factor RsiW
VRLVTEHVSAFTLDALALGALSADDRARVEAHLEHCAACRRERDAGAARRVEFAEAVLPRTLPGLREGATRGGWPVRRTVWLAAAAAAAVVLALVVRARREPELGVDLGIKGGPAWQVVGHRDQRTFVVRDGAPLAAGDGLRFVIMPDGAPYLLIASIDGAGAASIYFPYRGARSERLDGARIELPGSIVLDDAPGPERLFALFSDEPIDAASIEAQLRELGARGPDAIRATPRLAVAARAQLSLVFEKQAP